MVRPSGETSTCIHVTSSVVNSIVSAVFSEKPSGGFAVSSCACRSCACITTAQSAQILITNSVFFMVAEYRRGLTPRQSRIFLARGQTPILGPMHVLRAVLAAAITAVVMIAQLHAVTRVPSADGQFWDIQDTSPWSQDSGGIATGGRSSPFNGFGYLKLQVRRGDNSVLARNHYLRGFGLHHDGKGRFDSITPVVVEGVVVDRNITTREHTNYLRYIDTFTNTTEQDRLVQVAWGGAVG